MIITVTTPHLSVADKSLISAALKKATFSSPTSNITVVMTGDGVYAQALEQDFFSTLMKDISSSHHSFNGNSPFYALQSDVTSRGVQCHKLVNMLSNSEFAALSSSHQQWVVV